MARPRKTKPKSATLSLDLPAPRPLSGLERELYELLVSDLEGAVESRIKTERRRAKATAELANVSVREGKLRTQLATFEPTLDGFGAVVPPRIGDASAGATASA